MWKCFLVRYMRLKIRYALNLNSILTHALKIFFSNEVKIYPAPYFKGLKTAEISNFIVIRCSGKDYLPTNYIECPSNKVWLWKYWYNFRFIYFKADTLNPVEFQNFFKAVIHIREEQILKKKNLEMKWINRMLASTIDLKTFSVCKVVFNFVLSRMQSLINFYAKCCSKIKRRLKSVKRKR